MTNIFETAARKQLRVETKIGLASAEMLWEFPLVGHPRGADLNTVAISISRKLKDLGEENFVETARPNPAKRNLELGLDIVKHIIAVKQEEAKRHAARALANSKRQTLVEALANRQNADMQKMTEAEILAELRKIDDEASDGEA